MTGSELDAGRVTLTSGAVEKRPRLGVVARAEDGLSTRLRRTHPALIDRPGRRWLLLHPVGFVVGTAFAVLALTPSLIPRDWLFQGIVSGLSAAVGYAIGVLAMWLLRHSMRYRAIEAWATERVPAGASYVAWRVLLVAAVLAALVMLVAGALWQQRLAALMGTPPPSVLGWMRSGPVAVVVFVALLALVRGMRDLDYLLARLLRRRYARLPRQIARAIVAVVLAAVLVALFNQVVWGATLSVLDSAFSGANDENFPGVDAPPASANRSGSAASLVPWTSLGREGRSFVNGGRPATDLAAASGHAPVDPIRVYVGLESSPDPQARADLAVRELARTGAFARPVIAVGTTTGTGLVDPALADNLELPYGGDTAVVATQYSFLPSPLSFLLDGDRVNDAGRTLFDSVRAAVASLPPGVAHPRVVVFGESLGSQGSESAFTSLADVRTQTDGALWVGPPNSNTLWKSLVDRRDPGTTEVRPQYADGLVVRWGGGTATSRVAATPPTPWYRPRVLYLQHPSDPVVWWSPNLIWSRPNWLNSPRGDDVLGAITWYPVVTFWQVSADMANAQSVPFGHGHNYGDETLTAWMDVVPPPGWAPADTARAAGVLHR